MSRSLGQRLLRRLLARQMSGLAAAASAGQLPAGPTVGRLREAVRDAQTGRSAGAEQLALLLLAADRSAAGEVLASAAQLLLSAAPSVWLSLDVAARRSRAHRDGPGASRCGLSAFLYAGGGGWWPGRY